MLAPKLQHRRTADAIRKNKQGFWYVYILSMQNGKFYTGYTQNIDERLFRHKNGMVLYTIYRKSIQFDF
jgi:predicted GIY-YIG superfamily endonuclease